MREKRLVLEGSFCNMNLYADGPKTYVEAAKLGEQLCPRAAECREHGLGKDHQCIMMTGLEVARNTLRLRTTVEAEMVDFRNSHSRPAKGWLYSCDRKIIELVPEGSVSAVLIERIAHVAMDDEHASTRENLRIKVGSRFENVIAHAMTPEGAIDTLKMQELEGRFGSNGGVGCDVLSGPCSCGAWH